MGMLFGKHVYIGDDQHVHMYVTWNFTRDIKLSSRLLLGF